MAFLGEVLSGAKTMIQWQEAVETVCGVPLRILDGGADQDGDYALEPLSGDLTIQSPEGMGWPLIVRPDGRHWCLPDDEPIVRNRGHVDLAAREAVGLFQWAPGRRLLRAVRSYQRGGWAGRKISVLSHRFWSVVSAADIPVNSRIGRGLLIPHPQGIVINPEARIGERCLIFQQVTIGTIGGKRGAPVIGSNVDIGAGAKILGPVNIGDGAKIGANAVVLSDVPPGSVAVGIPAKVLATRAAF